MRELMGMRTTVDRLWLLEKLIANRESHLKMFEEARAGFLDHAKKELLSALEDLKHQKGRVEHISFSLAAPQDHSADYDTVIGMLKASSEPTISLDVTEFRTLVEDQWSWAQNWAISNSGYSRAISTYAKQKGYV